MTSPGLKQAGKQHLGKHRPSEDCLVQHHAGWCRSGILQRFYIFPINLESPFSALLSPTWKSPSQHNPRPQREAAQLTLAHLTLALQNIKRGLVYPECPRADILEGFWITVVGIKEVKILINDPLPFCFFFFFPISHKTEKKWHGLNFYNVLFSFVRRKFSSLGAKSREIKSVFRQLNKRLNYQKQQYPVFSSCYQKRLRSYFIFKRVFSNSKKKTFLFAKHSHRKHPSGNEGQEANWKTTIKFFPFTVQLLATGNRQDGFSSNGTTVIKGLMLSCSSIPLQWRAEPKLLPVEMRKSRDSQCLCLLLSLFLCFALWSENLALAAVFTPSLNPPSDSNQLNTAWPNFFSPSKPGGTGH